MIPGPVPDLDARDGKNAAETVTETKTVIDTDLGVVTVTEDLKAGIKDQKVAENIEVEIGKIEAVIGIEEKGKEIEGDPRIERCVTCKKN